LTDDKLEFRAFMRRNEDLPEKFSIGLAFLAKDGSGEVVLLRCSGPHGGYNQNLFYEQLAGFVEERLAEYNPRRNTLPTPDHDEYEVDYQFDIGPRPLFQFGVKDNDKARLATISCLEFQRRRIPFKGVMVHQDFESGITKKDRTRITSASDKQFPSLDDFRENGPQFFERERAA
jgi:hypothetical protein